MSACVSEMAYLWNGGHVVVSLGCWLRSLLRRLLFLGNGIFLLFILLVGLFGFIGAILSRVGEGRVGAVERNSLEAVEIDERCLSVRDSYQILLGCKM